MDGKMLYRYIFFREGRGTEGKEGPLLLSDFQRSIEPQKSKNP